MNEKPIAEIVEELSLAYCVPNRAAVVTQSLEGLLGNLMKRVPCRKGVLVLVKEDKSLQPVHWFNFESVDEKKAKWEISKSLAEHACEKKSVIRVHVADEWTRSKFPTAGTHGSTSILSAPLLDGARILGVFQLFDRQGANPVFSDQDMHIAGLHSISISLYLAETRRFAGEYREEGEASGLARLRGESRPMMALKREIEKYAPTDQPVLIMGESGTGKELIAKAIHELSRRAGAPFVEVNAAALTPSLIESELFGHVKGAFTGALGDRPGIFERARGGTVFLDEIGDAPPETQVKLLKVLQDKVVARIGDLEPRSVDFRLVSATNKPLQKLIKSEKFREDLYYRLNGCVIEPPPLRKREGDIRTLAMHFADEQAKKLGLPFMGIAPAAVAYLEKQRWPGNVRELQNVAANAFIQAQGLILREHLRVAEPEKKEPPTPERVVEALRESGGDITLAMEKIGSNRNWYYRHEDAIKALQKGV